MLGGFPVGLALQIHPVVTHPSAGPALHQSAAVINAALRRSDRAGASRLYDEQTRPALESVQKSLGELRKTARESRSEGS